MLGGTLPIIKWITWSNFQIGGRPLGISSNTLECLLMTFRRSGETGNFEVWTSNEHNCATIPWCPLFNNFIIPLELTTLLGFPVIPFNSYYFPSHEIFMKIFWKWKSAVPNDCNHWIPKTTLTPPIGITIIWIFNTYPPIDILILWHFHEQSIVPPSAIITWNYGAGYTKQLRTLANLQWMKLWVLLESINTITFFFLTYPSIMTVWGVLILANAWQDIVGVILLK